MQREYAIDKQQRSYENRIRQLKQEERQLRACGMDKEASAVRKKWRRLTKDYQIYSVENNRAYYPYRYVIDRSEEVTATAISTVSEESATETVDNSVNWSIINNKQYFDNLKSFIGGKRTVINAITRIFLISLHHTDE